ncbi:MAG: hypothetical protein AAFX78_20435 [Cyanobacteria bacterium J06638_20]
MENQPSYVYSIGQTSEIRGLAGQFFPGWEELFAEQGQHWIAYVDSLDEQRRLNLQAELEAALQLNDEKLMRWWMSHGALGWRTYMDLRAFVHEVKAKLEAKR